MSPASKSTSLCAKLGLETKQQRAWALYDWANSAFMTTVVAAVFPIYFKQVVAADLDPATAQGRYAAATAIGLAAIAITAPLLGRVADRFGLRKVLLFGFTLLGALATGALFWADAGDVNLALIAFVLANLGAGAAVVFYDSLLPHVATTDQMDRVSTGGFALGYLGGGLLLALHLDWISNPERYGLGGGEHLAIRAALLSVGVWWLLFTIPLMRRVAEPPKVAAVAGASLGSIRETLAEIRRFPEAFKMLVAFLIYNDGILTIIRMAALFGASMGLEDSVMIQALLLVQFIGLPAAFLFGALAKKIGSKRAVIGALAVYCFVTILASEMSTSFHFYALATLVGCVQGGSQALSRSLFGSLIPRKKSAEFFGFFAVGEKFAGVLGPGLYAIIVFSTGDDRTAIRWIAAFFVVGAMLLSRVDVEAGRKVARAADKADAAS